MDLSVTNHASGKKIVDCANFNQDTKNVAVPNVAQISKSKNNNALDEDATYSNEVDRDENVQNITVNCSVDDKDDVSTVQADKKLRKSKKKRKGKKALAKNKPKKYKKTESEEPNLNITEGRLYQCPHCKQMFYLQANSTEDSGKGNRNCPHCKDKITKLADFKTQLYSLKDVQTFECTICKGSFSEKYDLIRHAWRHSDVKKYQCDMSFVETDKLHIHRRIHTREKPYQCTACGKRFSQKAGLNYHTRTGVRSFQCATCSSAFIDRTSFKNHTVGKKRIHVLNVAGDLNLGFS